MNVAGGSEPSAADAAQASSPEPAESLTPGELLRRERERRSLTQLHIAEELHLDARMIEAIETNRFDELGVPVYARGHLRQYAALVGVSPQLIIQRYEALTGRQEVPAPIPASVAVGSSVAFERRSLAGPLWLAVGLVALILGWWLWSTVARPGDPMQQAIESAGESTGEAAGQDESAESSNEGSAGGVPIADESAASAAAQESVAANSAASPAGQAAGAGQTVRLRLEFSDASWIEIYDGAGKRLMYGLGEAGRSSTISGVPPLRVTLGKASAVAVQVNDRSVVVPRRAGRDAAKFVITAGGAVEM